jgi:hypothetical protein
MELSTPLPSLRLMELAPDLHRQEQLHAQREHLLHQQLLEDCQQITARSLISVARPEMVLQYFPTQSQLLKLVTPPPELHHLLPLTV